MTIVGIAEGLDCLSKESLDFMPIDRLYELVKETMQEHGIQNYQLLYYSVIEGLFDEMTDYYNENHRGMAKGDVDSTDSPFGEKEDFYYVKIIPLIDGIEVFSGSAGNPDKGNLVSGTDIDMIITQSGIEMFRLGPIYETVGIVEENESLITPLDAEKAVMERFANTLFYNPVTYSELKLAYLPIPEGSNLFGEKNNKYLFTPFWVFADGEDLNPVFDS